MGPGGCLWAVPLRGALHRPAAPKLGASPSHLGPLHPERTPAGAGRKVQSVPVARPLREQISLTHGGVAVLGVFPWDFPGIGPFR